MDVANPPRYRKPLDLSDNVWKPVPASAIVQPTAEMKADLAARQAGWDQLQAERSAWIDANPDLNSSSVENNTMYETNVATLDPGSIKSRISYIIDLIQSGESDKYSFRAGNGDQTTTSIHQFLYWLQLRDKELDSDGTYSPEMFAK